MKTVQQLTKRIEEMEALDRFANLMQKVLSRIVPQESALKDLLSGTWLGRPLHPMLTDVVIGVWTSASVLDILGGKRAERAADQLVLIGNVAALPTIAAGLSDWAELWGAQQRVGTIHALGNATALSVQTLSLKARRSGKRKKARLLSLTSMAIAGASAYLGGNLSFVKGVGVNQTAFEEWPQEWTPVIAEEDLVEDTLTPARADGVRIMLYKKGELLYALSDRCSHRGCPLHLGQVNDLMLECSCHGSIFRLSDGGVVRGPATVPAPTYEVRYQDGKVEVRLTVR
ncbi:MAG: Rieske 2Fe-2S domain-containing protein [Pseudonocardiaceae bacterium]